MAVVDIRCGSEQKHFNLDKLGLLILGLFSAHFILGLFMTKITHFRTHYVEIFCVTKSVFSTMVFES